MIPKKALEWVVLRPLEPSQPVETLANWVGKAHSEGSPSQHPWMPKRLAGGGRDCNGSYIPSAPFNNDTVLLWCPALFPQTFPVVELLTPILAGCLFTANNCLSLCPLSKPHVPAPSPSPHQQATAQAGACRAAEWNIHVGLNLSYLSQTSCCAFLQAPEAPLLSQLICPMVRGLP